MTERITFKSEEDTSKVVIEEEQSIYDWDIFEIAKMFRRFLKACTYPDSLIDKIMRTEEEWEKDTSCIGFEEEDDLK